MSDDLPTYWEKVNEPELGTFELVMLTGYEVDGNIENRRVLYVCRNLHGALSEAFEWKDVSEGRWRALSYSQVKDLEKRL